MTGPPTREQPLCKSLNRPASLKVKFIKVVRVRLKRFNGIGFHGNLLKFLKFRFVTHHSTGGDGVLSEVFRCKLLAIRSAIPRTTT